MGGFHNDVTRSLQKALCSEHHHLHCYHVTLAEHSACDAVKVDDPTTPQGLLTEQNQRL